MIVLAGNSEKDPLLNALRAATVRSMVRPEAAGFRRSILENLQETFVRGPEGPHIPAIKGSLDLDRFDRVAERIVKAVFFFERGWRLPSSYSSVVLAAAGLRKLPGDLAGQLRVQVEMLLALPEKHIGGEVFTYRSHYDPDDLNQSSWLLIIHRKHFFFGWTIKTESSNMPPWKVNVNDSV
jgi:hypothetical protein